MRSASSTRVLFIDDDALARTAFARALASSDYHVDLAADAKEAFTLAQRDIYPIIATDFRMPGLDGLSLIEALRPVQPYSSFLLVTGAPVTELPEQPEERLQVVSKPWSIPALRDVLKEAAGAFDIRQAQAEAQTQTLIIAPKILIVEGDSTIADQIKHALDEGTSPKNSREIDRVAHMDGATRALQNEEYQVILAELHLPDAKGPEVIMGLHRSAPETPIIALADNADDQLAAQALQLGAQDCLVKAELNPKSLNRAIRYAIERKRSERRLAFLAQHDQLTGLANRTLCRDRITQAIARCRRYNQRAAIMSIDLNRFKSINEGLGHGAGDALLREVALRLKTCVRDYDTVARLSGDEFSVVLDGLEDENVARSAADRILRSLDAPVELNGHQLSISISIGIALFPDVGETVDELLKAADTAMHQARTRGHSYQFARAATQADLLPKLRLENDLRHALDRNEFILHYQPQVDIKRRQPTCLEALIRWNRNSKLVPPFKFIDILEETRLITKVGAWVIEESCRKLKALQDMGLPYERISVNVSPVQFDDDDLFKTVMDAIANAGLAPQNLELEITESVLMQDTQRSSALLEALKEKGIRVAIDDFGTGYSSLAYLKRFSVDTLKIDRSFIRDLQPDDDEINGSIAGAIIGLGHKLGFEIVAEGVETAEQLAFLEREGCDIVQGYYLSRPVEEPEKVVFPEY